MTFAKPYRWGIIGPGKIAEKFASALPLAGNAALYAVASRDEEKAKAFAERFGAKQYYRSYQALAEDQNVDAVYIATPHAKHIEQVLLCLQNGKGVLCEKPLALNAWQVAQMNTASERHNAFLMEAMWSRFLPVTEHLLVMVQAGMIGEITHVEADFGFAASYDPAHRLFNPLLGGGALLDVGVYPLFLCQLLLGAPQSLKANAILAKTGVDLTTEVRMKYDTGATALAYGGFSHDTGCTAAITGTKGTIRIPTAWYKSDRLTLETKDGEIKSFVFDPVVNGFEYEIREVQHCLGAGAIESPFYSHEFSYELARTMDDARKQAGVVYPADQQ